MTGEKEADHVYAECIVLEVTCYITAITLLHQYEVVLQHMKLA